MLKTSALRIVIVLIVLFFVITNFEAFRGEALDAKQALLTGVGIDAIIKSFIGLGKEVKIK